MGFGAAVGLAEPSPGETEFYYSPDLGPFLEYLPVEFRPWGLRFNESSIAKASG